MTETVTPPPATTPPVTPPAAGGLGTPPTPATPPAATTPPEFYATFKPEFQDFVKNKGAKTADDLAMMYRNLESMTGDQSRLLKIPAEDDPKSWDDFYGKLGRQETAEKYKIELPKEGADPELAKAASNWFHKAGLTQKQVDAIIPEWNKTMAAMGEKMAAEQAKAFQAEQDSVKKEWGEKYEANMNAARKAITALGVEPNDLDTMMSAAGFSKLAGLFARIHEDYGVGKEAGLSGGKGISSTQGVNSADQAKARLEQLKADGEWRKKYASGDPDAVKEFAELQKKAAAGKMVGFNG